MQEGKKNFSELLSAYRKASNVSKSELSRKTGLAYSSICNYEKGRRLPDRKTILKIAKALNVSAEELLKAAGIENEETEEAPPALTRQEIEARLLEVCSRMNTEGLKNVLTVTEWLATSSKYRNPKID